MSIGKKSLASSLPGLGCGREAQLPFKSLLDVADIVASLFTVPSAQPKSLEDKALAMSHVGKFTPDNPFGCIFTPQQP